MDFYRTATTEATKLVTGCKRTNSPKRNYPLQARQSDSPNLPLVASEQVPTIPTASKTKAAPTYSPELPHLRTNFQRSTGNSAALCPAAITKHIQLAPPAHSHGSAVTLPRGINPKKGAAAPFIGRRGIVKGAHRKAPLTAFLYTAGGAFFPRGKERGAEPPP